MLAIASKEFKSLFKSIKSLVVILIIILSTLGISKIFNMFENQLNDMGLGENPYSAGFSLIIVLFGPLFVFALSHNSINEEIKTRTMRFLVTKTDRSNIIIGKFLGVILFWSICLLTPSILLIYFSGKFDFHTFVISLIFISYFIGLSILVSTIFSAPIFTNFFGIALSLVITIVGFWSIGAQNLFLKGVGFITPFYYLTKDNHISYLISVFPVIFILISILILKRKDL